MTLIDSGRGFARRLPTAWGRRLREAGKFVCNYKGARSAGLRGWWFARAGRHSELLVAPFGDGRLLVDANDDEIGRVVYMRGGYEREYMRTAFDHLAARSSAPRGDTFVDVGANIGTTTVDALLHFGFDRAICFEPDPDNLRLLRANLVLNDLEIRATTYPYALSDREGSAALQRHDGNSGDSRISAPGVGPPVRCMRFDTLVADGRIDPERIGMLWIDAQGHDARVLAGAATVTRAGIPAVVEYWPDELAATDGLELLEDIVREHYRYAIDLRALERGLRHRALIPAADVVTLRPRYAGDRLTDLLLVR